MNSMHTFFTAGCIIKKKRMIRNIQTETEVLQQDINAVNWISSTKIFFPPHCFVLTCLTYNICPRTRGNISVNCIFAPEPAKDIVLDCAENFSNDKSSANISRHYESNLFDWWLNYLTFELSLSILGSAVSQICLTAYKKASNCSTLFK